METIERIFSRPVAKPYRSNELDLRAAPYLSTYGHIDFAPDDIENPKNWSPSRRWYCTFVAVLLVVNATFASSSPSANIRGIAKTFQVSEVAAGLVITLFLLGYCAGPLVWAPLSEFYGRRWVFYSTFSLYVVFNFLCAFAPNFASLLIGRLLTGTFVSAPITNAPGVVADLWGPVERGKAMAVFGMMVMLGPALGPVVGGALELKEDWRWGFYVLLWMGGFSALFMLTLPETYPPIVLVNKARRIRATGVPQYQHLKAPFEADGRGLIELLKIALLRPWRILIDPIALLVTIYISVVYVLLYMLFTIYPLVFQGRRGWNAFVGELPLLGVVIGGILGGAIVMIMSRQEEKKMKAGIASKAEDRLSLAICGGIIFPITMFWFAWSAQYNSVHWIVPTIAGTFLSTAIQLIFVAYLNYLTDTYLMYTASAMAANTIARSACASAAPLFTSQMFSALGIGGGGSLIGGVAVLLSPVPFIFYRYGESIRRKSKYAPTLPKIPNDQEKRGDPNQVVVASADQSTSDASNESINPFSRASSETESGHLPTVDEPESTKS